MSFSAGLHADAPGASVRGAPHEPGQGRALAAPALTTLARAARRRALGSGRSFTKDFY